MTQRNNQYKPRPDSGVIRSVDAKRSEKSPDYWGEIAINLKDMTNIRQEDGLTIIKLSGWKRQGMNGKSYLSIAVDRYVPKGQEAPEEKPKPKKSLDDMDDDIPF